MLLVEAQYNYEAAEDDEISLEPGLLTVKKFCIFETIKFLHE